MSEATTPANPTDQIATIAAYDWREDYYRVENVVSHDQAVDEADCPRCSLHRLYELTERLEAERDALRAEHEAVGEATRNGVLAIEVEAAYDNAERVIHGE